MVKLRPGYHVAFQFHPEILVYYINNESVSSRPLLVYLMLSGSWKGGISAVDSLASETHLRATVCVP